MRERRIPGEVNGDGKFDLDDLKEWWRGRSASKTSTTSGGSSPPETSSPGDKTPPTEEEVSASPRSEGEREVWDWISENLIGVH